jgi:hypothetical protein
MSFLIYFSTTIRRIHLVDKKTSWLMRATNLGLLITNKLGWTNIPNFLTDWTTTLRHSIYSSPRWTWDMAPSPILVHELTHVLQWNFLYVLRYLLSPTWRCRYEAEAIQAEMLCFESCRTPSAVREATLNLVHYGINLDEATDMLLQRLLNVRARDRLEPSAQRVWEAFYAWDTQR